MNKEIINNFNDKGCTFLKNVFNSDKINDLNNEINNFMNENNIYIHLNKRQDVQENNFYVNNSYTTLNNYQKIQHYYLPVIDNRKGYNRVTDSGMIDIYNANKLFPNILIYFDLNLILTLLNKITGHKCKLLRTNIQLCNNVVNTNSFHFDNLDKCIKFTIYLSDIENNNYGPPVFIEKTHRDKKNIKTDDIKTFLGNKGDVLISLQNGFHRKLPQSNTISGFLVFNFTY